VRWVLVIAIAAWATEASVAQTTRSCDAATNPAPASAQATDEKAWNFSLSAYTYFVPDDSDYVQVTFTADRDWLHLEARYNYEDIDTGSVWLGYNLSLGEEITLDFTPMIGGVFGSTEGVAPGYEATLSWWKLELYTEGEYVIDTRDSSDSFFYTWSELTLAPVEWFRFGLVIQRTRAYETDFDIQRGLLAGFAYKNLSFTTYVFNPDDDPTIVLGFGIEF
jgi:hypothetical protein